MSTIPPILQEASITGTASDTTISLDFNVAMARGAGMIIVTDGAVQTVIDRATGLPTQRIIGATETHEIPPSMVSIDGSNVVIHADGLTPGHQYRVFIAPGVLQSNGKPFAGVSSSSLLAFTTPAVTADTTAPTVEISTDSHALASGKSANVTFTFSEAVAIGSGALLAPDMTISELGSSDGGKTWHATVTAHAGLEVNASKLTLDMSAVRDQANNKGAGTPSLSFAIDTKAPTATIALSGNRVTQKGIVDVAITFSEAVKDLDPAYFRSPNAQLSALTTSDHITWHATLSSNANVNAISNVFSLDMTKVQDVSGNVGSGSATAAASYDVDTTSPTATLSLDHTHVTATHGATLTIHFSEPVSSLEVSDFSVPNGQLTNLQSTGDGSTWTATLTGSSAGASSGNQVALDMSKVEDLFGNPGSGAAVTSYDVDLDIAPSSQAVAFSSWNHTQLKSGGSIVVTLTFTTPVPALSSSALTAAHATIGDVQTADGGKTWSVELVANEMGVNSADSVLTVDLSKVEDSSHKTGTGSAASPAYSVDTIVASHINALGLQDDSGISSDDLLTNNARVTFNGTLSAPLAAGEHVELTIDGISSGPYSASGPDWYYSPTSAPTLADGTHVISVRVVGDGHASEVMTTNITTDTRGPEIVSAPGATPHDIANPIVITFDEAVYLLSGSGNQEASDDDGIQVELEDGEGNVIKATISASNLSADHKTLTISASQLNLQNSKDYTLYLPENLTDRAGNLAGDDDPIRFHTAALVDTIAPYTLGAAVRSTPGAYGAGGVISIDVVFSEAMQVVGGTAPKLALSNGRDAVFVEMIDDGRGALFTYEVGANDMNGALGLSSSASLAGAFVDMGGNVLRADHINITGLDNEHTEATGSNIVIDTVAPSAPAGLQLDSLFDTGVAGDLVTSKVELTFAGSGAEADNVVKLYEGETLRGSGTADAGGMWSILTDTLGEGPHKLTVVQLDAAGNQSAPSTSISVTVDHTVAKPSAPLLDSDTGTLGDNITKLATPTIKGSAAEAGAKVEVLEGTDVIGTTTANADGVWSIAVSSRLDGTHGLSIRQTDVAGNASALSDVLSIKIDTAISALGAPTLSAASDSGSSASDRITKVTTPTLTGSGAEANAKIDLYEGSTRIGSATADANGAYSVSPTIALLNGVHLLSVVQTDVAGNESSKSPTIDVTIDTLAPSISSYTNTVLFGGDFQVVFSEKLVHGTGVPGTLFDVLNAVLARFLGSDDGLWSDAGNVSTFHVHPTVPGHVSIDFGTVTDLAGNSAIIGTQTLHFSFPTF